MPFDPIHVDTDPVVLALIRAKARIADPKNWCREPQARLADGSWCDADSPGAVRFCAVGSLAREYGLGGLMVLNNPAYPLLNQAAKAMREAYPAAVNHRGEHNLVIRMFDKAIESARALALQAR